MFKYISLTIEYIKRNFAGHMEYRINFIVEIVSMVINNFGFTFVWLLFFKQFQDVNGWGISEVLLLYALSAFYYGIGAIFAGGMNKLATKILNGELDFFLVFPKDVLWHMLISNMHPSVLGEIIFASLMFVMSGYLTIQAFALWILTGVLAAIIFVSVGVVYHSLSFFLGSTKDISERLTWSILGFTLYPMTAFQGGVKFILYTILPAGFIAWMPVAIITKFSLLDLILLIIITGAFGLLARVVFYRGLKKYESGNLINVQV